MKDFLKKELYSLRAVTAILARWLLLAVPTGLVCGAVGTAFHLAVEHVTEWRGEHVWLLWLLPLALAVAVFEGEFAGAVFGAVCGLMWDWLAGRTVGMLALELLLLCFAVSAVVQLYFKNSAANFALIASAAALLVLTLDWLFFYYMPGYSGAASRWLWFVLPTAALSVPVCFPLFGVVRRIHEEFKIDNGVV